MVYTIKPTEQSPTSHVDWFWQCMLLLKFVLYISVDIKERWRWVTVHAKKYYFLYFINFVCGMLKIFQCIIQIQKKIRTICLFLYHPLYIVYYTVSVYLSLGFCQMSLFMATLHSRRGHYIFALWFLLSFFLSLPVLSRRILDVNHTSTRALVWP